MTSEQYARIKEIFLEACSLPPPQRSSYISKSCAGDHEAIREVERLLAHHRPAPDPAPAVSPANKGELKELAAMLTEPPTFQTGDMVDDRYRIVSLLGEGGMGRVYRAEDLRLHKTVALKFLPPLHILDPTWRRRVEREVNLSRAVSHPGVCRIHDLGEVDGAPFISMEYVDGEDLSSLLRRVGRLTGPRAIDIARQLCAALAAAHIHGVLHRDLKPANVMIDGKGRVRITDFGLAVYAGQVDRAEIRSGTPRYMAPEQIAGIAVNERSDIYSLGLVLYEMFTGKPAFTAKNRGDYLQIHRTVEPELPSSLVPDIDPHVEAVILACLRKDPAERPESALTVAANLPGGDLLAAALDAGQIPTREILANAAAQGPIDRKKIGLIGIVGLLLFGLALILGRDTHPIATHGGAKSPEVLAELARQLATSAGWQRDNNVEDGRYFPAADVESSTFAVTEDGRGLTLALARGEDVLFRFHLGKSQLMRPTNDVLSFIMPTRTPFQISSDSDLSSLIIVDGQGRPLLLQSSESSGISRLDSDWQSLVRAAGYNPRDLRQIKPLTTPGGNPTEHLAFRVNPNTREDGGARIEIATCGHRVCFFAVLRESDKDSQGLLYSTPARWVAIRTARNSVLLALLAVALPLAWRNLATGGDVVGSLRVGAFVFFLRLAGNLLSAQHLDGFKGLIESCMNGTISALCEGFIVTLFYVSIESQVRQRWPRTLGSWSRLLNGRIRDSFVARDILFGCVIGTFWAILLFLDRRLPIWMEWNSRPQLRMYQSLDDLIGGRFAVAGLLASLRAGVYQGLAILFLLVIATWLTGKRKWLALAIVWLVGSIMYAPTASSPITAWTLLSLGLVALSLYVLTCWGLVSILSALLVLGFLGVFPITTNYSAWYAGYGIFACLATLGIGLWSLYEALRPPSPDNQIPLAAPFVQGRSHSASLLRK
ncbi:MAG: protein kinase [Planctomycetes bacterium]|nr:protein kinase [Planctomycetota bacterium]